MVTQTLSKFSHESRLPNPYSLLHYTQNTDLTTQWYTYASQFCYFQTAAWGYWNTGRKASDIERCRLVHPITLSMDISDWEPIKSGVLGHVEYFSSASSIKTAGESFFLGNFYWSPRQRLKPFASGINKILCFEKGCIKRVEKEIVHHWH